VKVYPLFYNPIPEECDLVRVFVDPIVAQEHKDLMNDEFALTTRITFTKYPYVVGQPVDVVE
jgi:hypothetical protein